MPMMDQVRCEDISLASDHREAKRGSLTESRCRREHWECRNPLDMYINGRLESDVYLGPTYASRASVPHDPIDRQRDT